MDLNVGWLRRRILLTLPVSIGFALLAAILQTALVLAALTSLGWVALVPWAMVGGQALVLVGLIWAGLTNPFGVRACRDLLTGPSPERRFTGPDEIDSDLAATMDEHRLRPFGTLWDDPSDPVRTMDLFRTDGGTVLATVNRLTGVTNLHSRLSDGRILLTDAVTTVPTDTMVVNPSPSGATNSLITTHADAIAELWAAGVDVVADDESVVLAALEEERCGLAALGPLAAAFFNPRRNPAPHRFLVSVEPAELRALALA